MVFRVTPSLGPDIEQVGPFYYDAAKGVDKNGTAPSPSYQLGSCVNTSNGRGAVMAVNGGTPLSAAARLNLDANFVATANGSGTYYTISAVPAGARFHAVAYTL